MHVITGGGTGIGRALALSLARDGHDVLVAGRRAAPLEAVAQEGTTADGGTITAVACDLSTPQGARALAERAGTNVDSLVHCAGGNPAIGRPESATLEEEAALLEETLAGNLVSAALTVTALQGAMGEGSAIVLLGSIAAERGVGYYGPAKAAVASYAVGLAAALGPRGIRVTCLSPGYISGTEFFAGTMTEERAETLRSQTALGRTGEPEDAVDVLRFLLSERSRHLTGQNIHLDGGAFTTR